MRTLFIIIFVVASLQNVRAQIEPSIYVGISSIDTKESQQVPVPSLQAFNNDLVNNAALFNALSEQLGGQPLGVQEFSEGTLSNGLSYQLQLDYAFNRNWGTYANLGYRRNKYKSRFSLAHFDVENNSEALANGQLSSNRNQYQASLGVFYKFSGNVPITLRVAGVLQYSSYSELTAKVGNTSWKAASEDSFTAVGLRVTPEVTVLRSNSIRLSVAPDLVVTRHDSELFSQIGGYIGITFAKKKKQRPNDVLTQVAKDDDSKDEDEEEESEELRELRARLAALGDCEDIAQEQSDLMKELKRKYLNLRAISSEITLDDDNNIKIKFTGIIDGEFDRLNTRANKQKVKETRTDLEDANRRYKECLEEMENLQQQIKDATNDKG